MPPLPNRTNTYAIFAQWRNQDGNATQDATFFRDSWSDAEAVAKSFDALPESRVEIYPLGHVITRYKDGVCTIVQNVSGY